MVLMTGIEPVQGCPQGILSPVRLPVPPHQHRLPLYSDFILHLPRFAPTEDFGRSVYTTRQVCLVTRRRFELPFSP